MMTAILIFILIQGLLFAAALMDIVYQQVYDLIWLGITSLGTVLIFMNQKWSVDTVLSLAIFFVIQEVLMRRVYGPADCHALCSLAVVLAGYGVTLLGFTSMLAVSFMLMIITELAKRNVGKNLRLKKEIPMIPYVTVGFWVIFDICVS